MRGNLRLNGRLDKLRKKTSSIGGNQAAVITGGMWTPATGFRHAGPAWEEARSHWCPFCEQEQASTMEHCLWDCAFFDTYRSGVKPTDAMTRRMGWSLLMSNEELASDGFKTRLAQMGKIREKVWKIGAKLFPRGCPWAETESGANYRSRAAAAAVEEVGD